jgi:hypothetical protein
MYLKWDRSVGQRDSGTEVWDRTTPSSSSPSQAPKAFDPNDEKVLHEFVVTDRAVEIRVHAAGQPIYLTFGQAQPPQCFDEGREFRDGDRTVAGTVKRFKGFPEIDAGVFQRGQNGVEGVVNLLRLGVARAGPGTMVPFGG